MTFDIDGQERAGDIDAGCDQLSEQPHTNFPLNKEDVGVDFPISTAVHSEAKGGLRIYPNPSDGNITVEAGLNDIMQIYNSAGILVYHQKINFTETKLDLSYLPAGVYIINLHSGGSTFRQIFIRR